MDIPIAKNCSLQIIILIEAEQWVITGALRITVVSSAFLIAIDRAYRTVHIKDDLFSCLHSCLIEAWSCGHVVRLKQEELVDSVVAEAMPPVAL